MAREETSGGSCGVPSGAGRGPLFNARRSVRDSVATLRDGMTKSWLEPVQADVEQLRQTAASLEGGTVEERQRNFEARASDIRGRARNIAARSNELGKSTAAEMRALAATVSVAPEKPGFSCYDPTLASRLTQAADQAEAPAELKLREAAFSEGPAGVANAVKSLWKNIGAYTSSLASYVASGFREPFAHTNEGEPITGRDLIALLATVGVDLGLLVLAMLNPPPAASRRFAGAEKRQIQAAIDTAIARTPGTNIEWVARHFVYHRGTSYLVIPNLASCNNSDEGECRKALAVNQLAGVLDDLDVVQWPETGWPKTGALKGRLKKSELQRLKDEEALPSDTDLTEIQAEWDKKERKGGNAKEAKERIRNHGLFSKAERALTIAGWSEPARRDIEVFRLVDAEGLTPLLEVLNADADAAGSGKAPDRPREAALKQGT
jgi:hypothetical protein